MKRWELYVCAVSKIYNIKSPWNKVDVLQNTWYYLQNSVLSWYFTEWIWDVQRLAYDEMAGVKLGACQRSREDNYGQF